MSQHRKDPTAAAALVAAALASADPVVYSCGVAALRRLKSDDVEATLIKDATWSVLIMTSISVVSVCGCRTPAAARASSVSHRWSHVARARMSEMYRVTLVQLQTHRQ